MNGKTIPRTVQVWLDDQYIEFEYDQPRGCDEDRLYEMVVDYVMSNFSVDIL